MSINDLPELSALRTRMQWHQQRQKVLAENVSNSDTPNFKPRDLVAPTFDRKGNVSSTALGGSLAMMRTSATHMTSPGGTESFDVNGKAGFQTRPAGNAVNLEEEMMKVSANQMDYAAMTQLYGRSLGLLKIAAK
jgi:flagellar basal-body rod protein FlgB